MSIDKLLATMYYAKTTAPAGQPIKVADALAIANHLYPESGFTIKDLREALEYDYDINVTEEHIFVGGDEPSEYQDVIEMVTDINY